MRLLIVFCLVSVSISYLMMYQKDSGYPAIQRVVKKGYFSTLIKAKHFFLINRLS